MESPTAGPKIRLSSDSPYIYIETCSDCARKVLESCTLECQNFAGHTSENNRLVINKLTHLEK